MMGRIPVGKANGGAMKKFGPDLADFIRLKRQLLYPEMVVLPDQQRIVADLSHRSEVASAAGISLAHYNRLEGGCAHPSRRVLDALVEALELTDDEAAEMITMVDAARRKTRMGVHPSLQTLLRSWPTTASFVCDTRFDVLASNAIAKALSPMFEVGANVIREMYLDPDAYGMIRNTEEVDEVTAGWAKKLAAAHSRDGSWERMIVEISQKRPRFRAALDGSAMPSGLGDLLLEHPAVGALDLHYLRFQPDSCPDQFLITLHADSDTPSEDGLRMLNDFSPPR
jgi:MmyB-like transcription regulator ligand binding domain/Helix-turn-helix domain